jgi:uncharacterized protein (DUF2062 family)
MGWLVRASRLLFRIEGSPTRVASAFALGVFIAFFPILGIHTWIALGLAIAFRLSKVAILIGVWTNNPWTVGPMLTAGTLVGCTLTGVSPATLGRVDWSLRGPAFYESLVAGFRPLVLPYVLGNLVLGLLVAVPTFLLLRAALMRRKAAEAPRDD